MLLHKQMMLKVKRHLLFSVPDKVKDLKVKVTETKVFLSWTKPGGNWDVFRVEYQNHHKDVDTEGTEVEDLIPGGCYTFSVITGVQQKSNWSEESSIAACTSEFTSHKSLHRHF